MQKRVDLVSYEYAKGKRKRPETFSANFRVSAIRVVHVSYPLHPNANINVLQSSDVTSLDYIAQNSVILDFTYFTTILFYTRRWNYSTISSLN